MFIFVQPHALSSRVKAGTTDDEQEMLRQMSIDGNLVSSLLPIKTVGVQVGHQNA